MTGTSRLIADRSGFTLIELLVVISILAMLVVAFVPDIVNGGEGAKIKNTEGRCLLLSIGINSFGRGFTPPDDLRDPEGKLELEADNGINTGIESLVVFLSQGGGGGIDLSQHAGWLANTDQDDNGALVPRLGTTERAEIVDAWGTPFAYFSSTTAGSFDRPQKIRRSGEEGGEVQAAAWKSTGGIVGVRRYQLVSAGKDQTFNTEDDIIWPERLSQ